MSNDSSSSDEDLEKFKEAVDEKFFSRDFYENGILKEKDKCSVKPSLRNQTYETAPFNPFTIKVTPEFQNHVSKHLSQLVDKLIDDTEVVFKKRKSQVKDFNCGVKLLHSSKNYLTIPSGEARLKTSKYTRMKCLDKINFEERAKEVAVSPEWVLSQAETKHWAPNTRGEIEIIKLDGLGKKSILPKKFSKCANKFIL